MTVDNLMDRKVFTVAGDTLNEDKYAYKIKGALLGAGYKVHCVGKELASLDEIPEEKIEVLDLCINPHKGLKLISECRKKIDAVLIQPGAGSDEIKALLDEKHIPYVEGCALKGLQARGLL